jgi:hypothetical protein
MAPPDGTSSSPQLSSLGPAVVPQYYSVQTPWGLYPAATLLQQQAGQPSGQLTAQQQQQQLLRGTNSARPVTPQGQDSMGTPTGVQPATLPGGKTSDHHSRTLIKSCSCLLSAPAGYQILAPAYYDQSGTLVMSNGRGMGAPIRLVSSAPILVNPGAQQGKLWPRAPPLYIVV